MKKMHLFFISLPFILSACQQDYLRGEGNVITQDRSIAVQQAFEAIEINGSTDLSIRYGEAPGLLISGYENLLNVYRTAVEGDVLVLEYPEHYNVRNDNLKIILTLNSALDVYLNGNNKVAFRGPFPALESMTASINGSGRIDYDNLMVSRLDLHINGSGDIDAKKVSAEEVTVKMSGSGKAKVNASELLKVQISGSGEVSYLGTPEIESNISGSGKIISLK